MVQISWIRPVDQPPGTRRLLGELKEALSDPRFASFRIIVAYAKSGPLLRLHDLFTKWAQDGKTVEAIFGYDQQGTSLEALQISLSLFIAVYITQEPTLTFHPKIYIFKGQSAARCFIGSNNLTVGGTERNFEAAIRLDLNLPSDDAALMEIEESWTTLFPFSSLATYAARISAAKATGVISGAGSA